MIHPEEIRRKAQNLYPQFLSAWLNGEAYFPRPIPCSKGLDEDLVAAAESVRRLRSGSKEILGYGYSVEWEPRNSHRYGRNEFPRRIVFETQDDFLRYVGKLREFAAFTHAVERIRARHPDLESWIRLRRRVLIESAAEVEGLLHVVDYLRRHPRPQIFAREIPVPVDTKFIERNRQVLREWLDRVLPPETIRADEEHFERRFGLRYDERHLLVRFLDPDVQQAWHSPWAECSIPVSTLSSMRIAAERVLIVENKVNLLTLPRLSGTLALGGLGDGVTLLRDLSWLASRPVYYWGDLDTEGFAILSRLRTIFPHVRSLLMDIGTLSQWKDRLAGPGTDRLTGVPPNLAEAECAAFVRCAEENLRIEQERFPQRFIWESLPAAMGAAVV